jgi:transketolase
MSVREFLTATDENVGWCFRADSNARNCWRWRPERPNYAHEPAEPLSRNSRELPVAKELRMIRLATSLKAPRAVELRTSQLEVSLGVAARFARRHAIAAIYRAGCGDAGAALSCAELLACLYGAELNLWPSTVGDPDRDRFVLSNARATPALYAIGAHFGFCDANEALGLGKLGSKFQVHPRAASLGYVEASTGTPGQGLSMALGMALGLRLERRSSRVYALMGGDEMQSGEVWEAAMCAAHHRLENFCAIVDLNRPTAEDGDEFVLRVEPLAAKWRAFDWAVAEVDGHDIPQILSAFRRAGSVQDRPALIVAHTVRGKGVPSLEGEASSNEPMKAKQAGDALSSLGMSNKEITELLDGR